MESTELRIMGFNPFRRRSHKAPSHEAASTTAASAKPASIASRLRRFGRNSSRSKIQAHTLIKPMPLHCFVQARVLVAIRQLLRRPQRRVIHLRHTTRHAILLHPLAHCLIQTLTIVLTHSMLPGATETLAIRLSALPSACLLMPIRPWRWYLSRAKQMRWSQISRHLRRAVRRSSLYLWRTLTMERNRSTRHPSRELLQSNRRPVTRPTASLAAVAA